MTVLQSSRCSLWILKRHSSLKKITGCYQSPTGWCQPLVYLTASLIRCSNYTFLSFAHPVPVWHFPIRFKMHYTGFCSSGSLLQSRIFLSLFLFFFPFSKDTQYKALSCDTIHTTNYLFSSEGRKPQTVWLFLLSSERSKNTTKLKTTKNPPSTESSAH